MTGDGGVVPDVVGMDVKRAVGVLSSAGCVAVFEPGTEGYEVVRGQSPGAGESVPSTRLVTLDVPPSSAIRARRRTSGWHARFAVPVRNMWVRIVLALTVIAFVISRRGR